MLTVTSWFTGNRLYRVNGVLVDVRNAVTTAPKHQLTDNKSRSTDKIAERPRDTTFLWVIYRQSASRSIYLLRSQCVCEI